MLTLYHGDSSVCAAKVRVTLAEKQLKWEGRLIDLNKGEQFHPDYVKLNPNAVVPTLVHNDVVVIESTVINEYLEEAFPEIALRPSEPAARSRMRMWTKREDSIHYAINTVTTASLFRAWERAKTKEDRDARVNGIPDPTRRKKWRDLVEHGFESEYSMEAFIAFSRLFLDMEAALRSQPWLIGEHYTLADIGFLSYLNRLRLLQMDHMWNEHFPRVANWFQRSTQRPAFNDAIMSYIPEYKLRAYKEVSEPLKEVVRTRFKEALSRMGS
jgi:glutathione S-transferase